MSAEALADDDRPHIYVDAVDNPDDVRAFYEIPQEIVERVRERAGGGGRSDTFAFDQALAVVVERLRADSETLRRIMAIPTPAGNEYADQVWAAIPDVPAQKEEEQ